MSTDQRYDGKENHANNCDLTGIPNPQSAENSPNSTSSPDDRPSISFSGVTFLNSQTIRVGDEFGDALTNPIAINRLQQDMRAWFMAYLPHWESSFAQSDLEQSIFHYQTLDRFLSSLVEAGIERQLANHYELNSATTASCERRLREAEINALQNEVKRLGELNAILKTVVEQKGGADHA